MEINNSRSSNSSATLYQQQAATFSPYNGFHQSLYNNQYHTLQLHQHPTTSLHQQMSAQQQVSHNPILMNNTFLTGSGGLQRMQQQQPCNSNLYGSRAAGQNNSTQNDTIPSISAGCSMHQQPIYNGVHQSCQSYPQQLGQPSTFQPAIFSSPATTPSNTALNQRHQLQQYTDCSSLANHGLNSFQQYHQSMQQQLPHPPQKLNPAITHSAPQIEANPSFSQYNDPNSQIAIMGGNSITDETNLSSNSNSAAGSSRLVDFSSTSSNATTATNSSAAMTKAKTDTHGKFKTYLTNLVLQSNIPFAYAIILVAFLITVIAATSIITILTIALTITGYTAYPITENTFNTSLAIGVVCASFALALVTASLVVWRRHCQAAYYYLDDPQTGSRGTNSPQLSETYDDTEYGSIPVNDWDKHVKKLHADSDIGFTREFEQIQNANSMNLTYEHSQLAENKQKNRYINIVAYDHTRVSLRQLPGQKKPGSDYINANFIDVSRDVCTDNKYQ